jgi:hypothetical protein
MYSKQRNKGQRMQDDNDHKDLDDIYYALNSIGDTLNDIKEYLYTAGAAVLVLGCIAAWRFFA